MPLPTTATANDKVFDALKTLRAQPALRTVPSYPDDPVYIAALANSIRTHLAGLDFEPEAILASFHGLPQAYVDKGDPYQEQCCRHDRGACARRSAHSAPSSSSPSSRASAAPSGSSPIPTRRSRLWRAMG